MKHHLLSGRQWRHPQKTPGYPNKNMDFWNADMFAKMAFAGMKTNDDIFKTLLRLNALPWCLHSFTWKVGTPKKCLDGSGFSWFRGTQEISQWFAGKCLAFLGLQLALHVSKEKQKTPLKINIEPPKIVGWFSVNHLKLGEFYNTSSTPASSPVSQGTLRSRCLSWKIGITVGWHQNWAYNS